MSFYRQQLEDFLKTLDVKAELVYDVGGAQGEVKSRVKSWDVKEYEVLDLPVWDLDTTSNKWKNAKKADLVFCLEVFEYLIRPVEALSHIKQLLKPGGKAVITFAFVYPYHNEANFDALRYSENGIRRMAAILKFNITNIWYRVDKTGLLQSMYSLDGMHPVKGYEHHNATGFIVEFSK